MGLGVALGILSRALSWSHFKMGFIVHVGADMHICQPPVKLTHARDQIPSLSVPQEEKKKKRCVKTGNGISFSARRRRVR